MAGSNEFRPFDVAWLARRGNFYCLITPDVAAQLMTRNTNNRSIKQLKIDQYARDMRAGKWHPDASDIKFASDGSLLDGQNRLLACVQADVPFPTLVRTGLDVEAQPHMDTGAVRTMGDVFRMHGVSDYNNVAAAISLRARYESILRDGGTIIERRLPLTRHESLEMLAEHPQVEKFSHVASTLHSIAPGIQRSVFIAAMSWAAEVDEELARRVSAAFIAGDVTTYPQLVAFMRYAMSTQTPKQQERSVKLKNSGLRHLTAMAKLWDAIVYGKPLDRITIKDDEKPIPFAVMR